MECVSTVTSSYLRKSVPISASTSISSYSRGRERCRYVIRYVVQLYRRCIVLIASKRARSVFRVVSVFKKRSSPQNKIFCLLRSTMAILQRSFSLLDSSATMKILLCLLLLVQCFGMPQMIVDSGKSKCVSVEAPQDTIIRISYDAPGKSSAVLIVCVTGAVSYLYG
jgi:hypothetical protein